MPHDELISAPHPFAGLRRAHYRAILIDPPTRFVAGTKSRPQHYKRMSDAAIAALPVQDLLHADGGWVGLWVTSPKIFKPMGSRARLRPDELADEWGLRYSGRGWLWLKLAKKAKPHGPWMAADFARGQGLTTGKNAEDCYLFRTAKAPRIKSRKGFELIFAPRREHSRKPDEIYDRIEQTLDGPYCELFARQRINRPQWDSWGDEVDLFGPSAVPLLQRVAA
jgi:N6-adenosine-specific RNA methylase IME4